MRRKWDVRFSNTYSAFRPGAEICYDNLSDSEVVDLMLVWIKSGGVCTSIRAHEKLING